MFSAYRDETFFNPRFNWPDSFSWPVTLKRVTFTANVLTTNYSIFNLLIERYLILKRDRYQFKGDKKIEQTVDLDSSNHVPRAYYRYKRERKNRMMLKQGKVENLHCWLWTSICSLRVNFTYLAPKANHKKVLHVGELHIKVCRQEICSSFSLYKSFINLSRLNRSLNMSVHVSVYSD